MNLNKLKNTSIENIASIFHDLSVYLSEEKSKQHFIKQLIKVTNYSRQMAECGYNTLVEILRKDNLMKRLEREFETPSILDDYIINRKSRTLVKASPLGVIFHVAPSNVFLGMLDSILMAFLTKNASIVKLSSNDMVIPYIFLESLKIIDTNCVIVDNLLYVEPNTADLQKYLSLCDAVMFWGGLEAEKFYRSIVDAKKKFIANGHRMSFSLVQTSEMSAKDYNALAYDILIWNQKACSSPQIVFTVTDYSDKFYSCLDQALSNQTNILGIANLEFDEKVEILRCRESLKMKGLDEDKVYTFSGTHTVIPVKDLADIPASNIGYGNIFVKKLCNIRDLYTHLENFKGLLQSCSIKVSRDLYYQTVNILADLGVTRITSLGEISNSIPGLPHDGRYLLHELVRFTTIQQTPQDRLNCVIDYAVKNSPYYAGVIGAEDRFEDIGLLDKNILNKLSVATHPDLLTSNELNGYFFCSGGSTGSPKYTFYSYGELEDATNILTEVYRQGGLIKEDIVANVFIAGNLWTSFLIANTAISNIGCTNLPVGGLAKIEDIFKYIEMFKPTALVGLPSIIIALARYYEKAGKKASITKVLYGGEQLSNHARKYISEHLGVKSIKSAGYAIVDTGIIGVQCQHLEGSFHHAISEYSLIEFIRDGKPVPDGEIGEIVVTNLSRYKMPTIRLRTGDLGRKIVGYECSCGNKDFVFELLGRCDDMIVVGGMNLQFDDISRVIENISELSPVFQVVVDYEGVKEVVKIIIETKKCTLDWKSVVKNSLLEIDNINFSVRQGLIDLCVELVEEGFLERNERTGKIRRLIDRRLLRG